MSEPTGVDRQQLVLDAQVSVMEAAAKIWHSSSVEDFPKNHFNLQFVLFGGTRRLARMMASEAIRLGSIAQEDALPSRLAAGLRALGKDEQGQVFLDALFGAKKGDKPSISPISSYPYPSEEQPNPSEFPPHIRVRSKFGWAAVSVSLWRAPKPAVDDSPEPVPTPIAAVLNEPTVQIIVDRGPFADWP